MKTLREIELEQEISALKYRVQELEYKAGMFDHRFVVNEPPTLDVQCPPPVTLKMVASVDGCWSPRNGWEVKTWAAAKSGDRLVQSYYMSDPELMRTDLPYLLDELHRSFQLGLLHAMRKEKTAA